ncbi:MAG: hypothetical protein JG718_13715 [Candidatus Thiothrix moscowensis]|nr:hypothetical protein [Candidatus Thiothrix moscowensis]
MDLNSYPYQNKAMVVEASPGQESIAIKTTPTANKPTQPAELSNLGPLLQRVPALPVGQGQLVQKLKQLELQTFIAP